MRMMNIHEAKTHLSQYIELAFKGEEIIICKSGKPMVKLIRYEESEQVRKPGYWEGRVHISDDFDELPDSISRAFRGEE